jgi:hypothetical protein
MDKPDANGQHDVAKEFKSLMNMSPGALKSWLETPDSKGVGMTHEGEKVTQPGGTESVGHEMGRRILSLHGKKAVDLDEGDYAAMRKVIGYVHRHMKQRPHGDVTETRWRKSLMNWGMTP